MKLCCLVNQKLWNCDEKFGFERFCDKPELEENCCLACQLGESLAKSGNIKLPQLRGLLNNRKVHNLIHDCFYRKKNLSHQKPEKLVEFIQNNEVEDIDECLIENNGCDESQTCENTIGSYRCIPKSICKIGFDFNREALTCTKRLDTIVIFVPADSQSSDSQPSDSIPRPIIKALTCQKGFKFNNETLECDDIDECKSMQKFCEHNCQNVKGGFKCKCRRGYRNDSRNSSKCIDIDECFENKLLCSDNCQNIFGSYRCKCGPGFKLGLNKRSCEDIDECGNGKVCGKKICNNLIGSFACFQPTCPDGYRVVHVRERNDLK